ncbi:DIP1281 family NlpC/P60 protein [Corynebacterium sp.]|uniref:DIP1281 family NlpC/P60 protein n=1 Tax=Corynebacterium sp. TaxID=1720 RepID=UPI0026E0CD0A|nr:NlpC/P60 family protein [Corynebacterium sp.]MDO5511115.1 NlpC/P60 family protein [Corynebacterium sp.]
MAPTTLTRARLRTVVASALCAATLTAFTPAVVSATPATAPTTESAAAGLVNDVTRTQAEMDRLALEIGGLHEEVNKALVDLHDAQATAEQARQAVIVARAQLTETQEKIEVAQARLDEISRATYRRSVTPTAVATLAGEEASADSLDRQTYLRTNAEKQRAAIEELDQLRTEQANRESELRQLRNIAEEREARALGREAEARAAIDSNTALIGELSEERDRLAAERDAAQEQLDAAREEIATGNAQRQDAEEYRSAEATRRAAEDAAASDEAEAAEARRIVEEESAAAAAAQEAAEAAARQAAEAEAAAQSAAEADERERREAEAAAAREAARQAEEEATARREAQERAEQEAAERAAREAEAQAFRDAATAAAVAAAAAVIAASQPDHTSLDNPYPSVTDEEADPEPIAAVQNPEPEVVEVVPEPEPEVVPEVVPEVEEELSTGPILETIEDVTEQAAEEVAAIGDREAQIEAVIARAQSQVGVPYAWGGGNANGPTRGIRDGGIADSHGDFNKIGFDCSGLTLYAFAGAGIALPHYTGYQYNHGEKIDPSQMERGDLIFYGPGGSHHVAIYLGDGTMIEAPNSGSNVRISPVRWSGMAPHAVRLI